MGRVKRPMPPMWNMGKNEEVAIRRVEVHIELEIDRVSKNCNPG